jgi:hypothetical protein
MALSQDTKVWIKENVQTLEKDCEDKDDALNYVDDMVDQCLEENDLTLSTKSEVEKAIKDEIESAFVNQGLTEEEWEQFFDLVNKIADDEPGSIDMKKAKVEEKAKEYSGEMNWEEVTSWWA